MTVTLTHCSENPVASIEEAASNCYNSKPSWDGKIMRSCIASGHTSVTEFATFTFHIDGVSRSLLAQITRHRVGVSFAVRSQRYCAENNFEYVIPPSIRKNDKAILEYKRLMNTINVVYKELQDYGVPNEDARMVLPNACYTSLEVSFNLRSLMHFMNERLCNRAQWEIRELAKEMKKAVVERFPELDDYLVPKCEVHKAYPFCTERQCCGKHPKLKDIYENFNKTLDKN